MNTSTISLWYKTRLTLKYTHAEACPKTGVVYIFVKQSNTVEVYAVGSYLTDTVLPTVRNYIV